jgi:drug/metabolite transporter (DMT)-like permease
MPGHAYTAGRMNSDRKPPDTVAFATMVLLCALWGFNQVTIKWAAEGISPVMQSGLRSILAAACVFAYARWKGVALFGKDGTLGAGIVAGLLFAAEFVLMYDAVNHISVSRLIVLVYTAPCMTAIGLHWWVAGERLAPRQWVGVLLAFAGIVAAFGEKFLAGGGSLRGDVQAVLAAALWAATTVVIRTTKLSNTAPAKTLLYQLGIAALLLPIASVLMGERGVFAVTPLVLACIVYQGVIVAFASYLAWFWLLTRYLATRLSVFSFLTPLFGVAFGMLLFNDTISAGFGVAAVLVGAGIALVNWRK